MKIIRGDLIRYALAGHFDVIVHGCNQRQTWGAGIARQMRRAFPEAYQADLRAREPARQLGMISVAHVHIGISSKDKIEREHKLIVVNAYTQRVPGRFDTAGNRGIDLALNVGQAMRRVKQLFSGQRIGYPQIAAGLAGGDWGRIAPVIDAALSGEDHTLVELAPHPTDSLAPRPDFKAQLLAGQWQDVGDDDE